MNETPNPALRVDSIAAKYEYRNGGMEVFRRLSLEVSPGCILGVVGPNGCGKSTLIRVLAGLHRPAATGKITVGSTSANGSSVSYVPQNFRQSFFPWANLATNILLSCPQPFARRGEHMAAMSQVVSELHIDVDLGLRPNACSGGMLQQAALLRALTRHPGLLLADEPFSALDIKVSRRLRMGVRSWIKEAGAAAVFVLHDPDELLDVCDEVLIVPSRPFSSEASLPEVSQVERLRIDRQDELRDGVADQDGGVAFRVAIKRLLGLGESS